MASGPIYVPAEAAVSPPAAGPPPRRHWPETVIAGGVLLTLCYVGEFVLVVMLLSMLLAFILAPVVDLLNRARLPRALASFVAVMLLLGVLYGVTYASYNEAVTFLNDLPKYSSKIRATLSRIEQEAENLRHSTGGVPAEGKNIVTVRSESSWTDLLTRGFGSVSQVLLAATFVPFLVYFMLSWQQHVRSATVMLFRMEHRHTAYVTLGLIAKMMRSFVVGNLLVGVFMSVVSSIIFALLHVPFFYFVGPISGFLSLVPYLGVVLAVVPPLAIGIGQIQGSDVIMLVLAVFALHVFSLNVLYPKFLGNKLQLNPLAVTLSLLFWGWLWGAMGLLLAIPLTGALKIVFDNVDRFRPYGAWLGE
jgi:predicted PurR-regulated permease PerM